MVPGVILKYAIAGYAPHLNRCFFLFNPAEETPGETMGLLVFACSHLRLIAPRNRLYRILYLLGAARDASGKRATLRFSLREAGAERQRPYALLHVTSCHSEIIDPDESLAYGEKGYGLVHRIAAPLMGGVAFFGDISKHVSGDSRLITCIGREPGYWRIQGVFAGNAPSRWAFHTTRRIWEATLNGVRMPCHWVGQTLILETETIMEGPYTLVVQHEAGDQTERQDRREGEP